MRTLLAHSAPRYRFFIMIATLLVVTALFFMQANRAFAADTVPNGKRIVTIHDRGEKVGILTEAKTLREVLDRAHIAIDKNDMVEPGLDEELVADSYEVNIYRARPVVIFDGMSTRKILSAYQTPSQIVKHANIPLRDEDIADIQPLDNVVSYGAGMKVVIDRALPVKLELYGNQATVYTQAETISELLKEKNIVLKKHDKISLPKDTAIKAGMKLAIWRDGKQTITRKESIDFPIVRVEDADRPVGYRKIQTPGKKGEKMVTYEAFMKNGKIVKKKKIQSVVLKKAVKQVEIVGIKMTNTFEGDFAGALARLRSCEGSYSSNTGNGYYGAYQFDIQTWGNYKNYSNASLAPPAAQDEKAWLTYKARGWSPWPSCSRSQGLQDIYR